MTIIKKPIVLDLKTIVSFAVIAMVLLEVFKTDPMVSFCLGVVFGALLLYIHESKGN